MGFNKKFFTTGGIVASSPAAAAFDPLQNFETVTYTGNGGTQKITGYIRKGAAFNGSSSYFYISGSEVIDFISKDYTISLFVNLSSNAADQVLISSWNNTTRRFQLVTTSSNRFLIYERNSSNTTQSHTLNYTYSTNTWYHIGIVRNSTQILFYVNGSLEQTVSANYSIYSSGSNDLWFGKQENSVAPASCYNGKLDQIRLFNTGLDSSKISQLAAETYASSTKSTTDIFGDGSGVALYELDDSANDTGGTYNGTATNVNFLGMAFQPDMVWVKARSGTYGSNPHRIQDSVRGDFYLSSSSTSTEAAVTTGIQSYDTNGFTVGSGNSYNGTGTDFVAWCWKAGGAAVSNTDGNITSSVSANQAAGFSIGTYSGNSTAGATIGHGLSATPELIIVKLRSGLSAKAWTVYAESLGNTKYLYLNDTLAAGTYNFWNNTSPTDSVFSVSSDTNVNSSSGNYVFYAFHSVDGYQKIGSYNGGASGNAITGLGFEPRFLIIKRTNSTGGWIIFDSVRDTTDPRTEFLGAHQNLAESTLTGGVDFDSDGFTLQSTNSVVNTSGGIYIYLAIA